MNQADDHLIEVSGPTVAGPQAAPGVTPRQAPTTAPPVLDGTQRALMKAVLNCLIPARAELPGAGDLDVAASIERTLSAAPALRRLVLDTLAEIAIVAARRTDRSFGELDSAAQAAVLEEVELTSPASFVALIDHAYRGYYTLPRVHQAVGFERPPQPLGHHVRPFDPALLERQRDRPPFWRRTARP